MTSPQPYLHILAIDQSTDATGVVVLECVEGKFYVAAKTTLRADTVRGTTKAARLSRLRIMRRDFAAFLSSLSCAIDLVAYEQPFFSAHSAHWDAAPMALGALLTVSHLEGEGLELIPVMRSAACLAAGCHGLYQQPAKTQALREAKRLRLKAAVITWANLFLSLSLSSDEDGIADACALGVAAWQSERMKAVKAAEKAAQKPLPNTGRPKVKA